MLRELAVRFVLGGLIVSLFSVAGELWRPKTFSGLFGAAPSVALASLARQAVDDDRGGRLGSVGLIAFALVVWALARSWPPAAVPAAATVAWLAVDGALWAIRHGRTVG